MNGRPSTCSWGLRRSGSSSPSFYFLEEKADPRFLPGNCTMAVLEYPESRGFTLIELLVVITIIGLLASVVLARLSSARAKARDARRYSDLLQLQLALELY